VRLAALRLRTDLSSVFRITLAALNDFAVFSFFPFFKAVPFLVAIGISFFSFVLDLPESGVYVDPRNSSARDSLFSCRA
jgi:hypothetical protein